jgi:hypothetical protein
VVKTDTALTDGVTQLEQGVGRLRDMLDALGADEGLGQLLARGDDPPEPPGARPIASDRTGRAAIPGG